jgi:hypothetical protein
VVPVESLTGRSLHGSQAKQGSLVPFEDEEGIGRAQHACGIEQDDRVAGLVAGRAICLHDRVVSGLSAQREVEYPYPVSIRTEMLEAEARFERRSAR